MKKSSLGMACVFFPSVLLILAGACSPAQEVRYACPDEGFSILLPKEWRVVEHSRGTRLLAKIPDQGHDTIFNQNLNVVVEEFRTPIDLLNYVELQISVLGKMRGMELSERSNDTVGGVPAVRFSYEYAIKDFGYRAVVYVAKRGKKFYVITGISQCENHSILEPRFHEIARSVRFE